MTRDQLVGVGCKFEEVPLNDGEAGENKVLLSSFVPCGLRGRAGKSSLPCFKVCAVSNQNIQSLTFFILKACFYHFCPGSSGH